MTHQRRVAGAIAVCVACLIGAAACGTQKYSVQRASIVPAADAEVNTYRDDNKNLRVTLDVERLAPPGNLTPPRVVYMVWSVSREGTFMPLGKLRVDEQGSGRFRGIAPVEPFRLMVTAENDANRMAPEGPQVLATGWIGG